jgi:hypothetical protein
MQVVTMTDFFGPALIFWFVVVAFVPLISSSNYRKSVPKLFLFSSCALIILFAFFSTIIPKPFGAVACAVFNFLVLLVVEHVASRKK